MTCLISKFRKRSGHIQLLCPYESLNERSEGTFVLHPFRPGKTPSSARKLAVTCLGPGGR